MLVHFLVDSATKVLSRVVAGQIQTVFLRQPYPSAKVNSCNIRSLVNHCLPCLCNLQGTLALPSTLCASSEMNSSPRDNSLRPGAHDKAYPTSAFCAFMTILHLFSSLPLGWRSTRSVPAASAKSCPQSALGSLAVLVLINSWNRGR